MEGEACLGLLGARLAKVPGTSPVFSVGREDEALPIFRQFFDKEPDWARLVPPLPASESP